jgi:pimeloyl-ACP methyl ester carboxylesterase
MRSIFKPVLLAILFVTSFAAVVPAEAAISNCLPDGTQSGGAKYRICMPEPGRWNGDLVLFAHGYVAFNEPIRIPDDQLMLSDGTSLATIANALGFAFAVTSYSKNGLAVREGLNDVRDLVTIFTSTVGSPGYVYLVGGSEGGIVTALAIEQFPGTFSGGLATCGPVGNFRTQIEYIGNFRVVFDYFFPGVLPGRGDQIPDVLIDNWDSVYVPAIKAAIAAHPNRVAQLLRVTRAPVGSDPATVEQTVLGLLWYSTFGTNDAIKVLGGQPFGNRQRWYRGSSNDLRLNLLVDRFDANEPPLVEIERHYQTTGALKVPLVTMHTTGDQIIPYWHESIYRSKTRSTGSDALHHNIPILRYGHCNFKAAEVLLGFGLLVHRVTGAAVETITGAKLDLAGPVD